VPEQTKKAVPAEPAITVRGNVLSQVMTLATMERYPSSDPIADAEVPARSEMSFKSYSHIPSTPLLLKYRLQQHGAQRLWKDYIYLPLIIVKLKPCHVEFVGCNPVLWCHMSVQNIHPQFSEPLLVLSIATCQLRRC
jgi:hypothetical protein